MPSPLNSITSAPPTAPTPPTPKMAGANRAASFRHVLNQQQAAATQAQSQAQAQTKIQAAKIASQSNVNTGLKHGLQLGGNHPKVTHIHPQQRFFPIHQSGSAVQTAPAQTTGH